MTTSPILIILAIFWMISVFSLYFIELGGTSWYDLMQLKKQKRYLAHPNAKIYRYKPLVSIIIPAHNEAQVLQACLDSIFKSSYRKLEVIVVNDASTDDTKIVLKDYVEAHPKKAIQLLGKRKSVGRKEVIKSGLKKAKGELIMVLNASGSLDVDSIKQSVRHFAEEDISILFPQSNVLESQRIISLLQQFVSLTVNPLKKLGLGINSEYIGGSSGTVYKRQALLALKNFTAANWSDQETLHKLGKQLANKQYGVYYASNVIVNKPSVRSYKSLLRQHYHAAANDLQNLFTNLGLFSINSHSKFFAKLRRPLMVWSKLILILEPLIMVYFVYLAISFRQPLFYLISWGTLTFLLGLFVWRNEPLSRRQKLRYTLYLPIMYNLVWLMRFVELGALLNTSAINISRIVSGNYSQLSIRNQRLTKRRA